eukprot:1068472-Amphidinium_carterae.2
MGQCQDDLPHLFACYLGLATGPFSDACTIARCVTVEIEALAFFHSLDVSQSLLTSRGWSFLQSLDVSSWDSNPLPVPLRPNATRVDDPKLNMWHTGTERCATHQVWATSLILQERMNDYTAKRLGYHSAFTPARSTSTASGRPSGGLSLLCRDCRRAQPLCNELKKKLSGMLDVGCATCYRSKMGSIFFIAVAALGNRNIFILEIGTLSPTTSHRVIDLVCGGQLNRSLSNVDGTSPKGKVNLDWVLCSKSMLPACGLETATGKKDACMRYTCGGSLLGFKRQVKSFIRSSRSNRSFSSGATPCAPGLDILSTAPSLGDCKYNISLMAVGQLRPNGAANSRPPRPFEEPRHAGLRKLLAGAAVTRQSSSDQLLEL